MTIAPEQDRDGGAHFSRFSVTEIALSPAALEAELGVPVLDSVAMAVWGSLSVAGIDPGRVAGWGHLFRYGTSGWPLREGWRSPR